MGFLEKAVDSLIKKIKALKPDQAAELARGYTSATARDYTWVTARGYVWATARDCWVIEKACLDQAYQWGKDAAHSFPRAAIETIDPFVTHLACWDPRCLEGLKDSWHEGYQDGDYDNRRDAYEAHEARCF